MGKVDDVVKTVQVRADNWVIYDSGYCFLLLVDDSETLLGDSFLRDLYIIHDADQQRMGFIDLHDRKYDESSEVKSLHMGIGYIWLSLIS